ncbi:glycosyltransferase involved in cell wall biosynthesis [Arthrobacter woluwensis]|uniref:glycosyltransferase family 4 protein n=1 Tax=Arthrobacter woluwensis TaxID=156980 RepID=UPI00278A0B60|nr:glycosyltransferase family 4 protein [Arthrobacter woluwensis]MDQ0709855.1 glycosyltransferase involved in cell wall biosynthesis [Arthrobacter woluwensis]
MNTVRFIVPGNIGHRSGGNLYNARLVEYLEALGVRTEVMALDGAWPPGRPEDRESLAQALRAVPLVIVDGLVAAGAPDAIEAAVQAGARVWVLSHMSFPGIAGLEGRALAAATGVICPSSFAASQLEALYGLDQVHVARPGARPAEPAVGSRPPRIVCVAALLPNKSQLLLIDALARLGGLPWTASLIGSPDADPEYAAQLRAAVARHGLEDRIHLAGELDGQELEGAWHVADLSVLVSERESFGMAVQESLAHGVPAVVRRGTGAEEALGAGGAGAAVDLDGGPDALTETLATWLEDPELAARWREAALLRRAVLPRWTETAERVLALLRG